MAQQLLAAHLWMDRADTSLAERARRLARAAVTQSVQSVVEAVCALGGHETIRCAEGDRLNLRCIKCGHTTQGWQVGPHARYAMPAPTPVRTTARRVRISPMGSTWRESLNE